MVDIGRFLIGSGPQLPQKGATTVPAGCPVSQLSGHSAALAALRIQRLHFLLILAMVEFDLHREELRR
jgi:hypothetical protein